MKINYWQLLLKQINNEYHFFRMSKDLPLSLSTTDFLTKYQRIENLIELKELLTHLKKVKETLWENEIHYDTNLWTVFNNCYSIIETSYQLLVKLYQEYQTWELVYNEENLLKFNLMLFTIFLDNLDYLLLKYQQVVLKHEQLELIKYLKSLQTKFSNQKEAEQNWIDEITTFSLQAEKYCQKLKQTQIFVLSDEINFFVWLEQFILQIKVLLFVYDHWLKLEQSSSQNSTNFLDFYLE